MRIERTGMQNLGSHSALGGLVSHSLLVGLPQLYGWEFEAGCQNFYMTTECVINPFEFL